MVGSAFVSVELSLFANSLPLSFLSWHPPSTVVRVSAKRSNANFPALFMVSPFVADSETDCKIFISFSHNPAYIFEMSMPPGHQGQAFLLLHNYTYFSRFLYPFRQFHPSVQKAP